MIQVIKPLRSGQITIPAAFRKKMEIDSETLLQMRFVEGEIRIRPVRITETAKDTLWFKDLYDLFGPVRKKTKDICEKEVNTLINSAVKAVRKSDDKGRI